jgi:hypothetical protein
MRQRIILPGGIAMRQQVAAVVLHSLRRVPKVMTVTEPTEIRGQALRPVEWASKLAERPSTLLQKAIFTSGTA